MKSWIPRAAVALLALAALAGCTPATPAPSDSPSADPAPSVSTDPSGSAEPSPSPEPDPLDLSTWQHIVSSEGRVELDIPPGWSAVETGVGYNGYTELEIVSPEGVARLRLTDLAPMGLAPTCDPGTIPSQTAVLEYAPMPALYGNPSPAPTPVEFGAVAMQTADGRAVLGLGVTPQLAGVGVDCAIYFLAEHPATGTFLSFGTEQVIREQSDASAPLITFDTMADAEAFADTDEFAMLRQIVMSLKFVG